MHTVKSLKAKKIISYFHTIKKTSKKNILACILVLITSLLKSRELDQYFKKNPNNIFFLFLVSWFTSLYVKRIPNIKKVVLVLTLERLGFTR
jgi:O-antigen ligase